MQPRYKNSFTVYVVGGIVTIINAGETKIIVTEEDTVTRRNLVLVKPLPTLKCSSQVNIFNVYVVEGTVAIINAEETEFIKSVTRGTLVLVKLLPTLKCSNQVNIINRGKNEFSKSVGRK